MSNKNHTAKIQVLFKSLYSILSLLPRTVGKRFTRNLCKFMETSIQKMMEESWDSTVLVEDMTN